MLFDSEPVKNTRYVPCFDDLMLFDSSTKISELVVAICCIFYDMMNFDLNVSLMIGSLGKPSYIEPPF